MGFVVGKSVSEFDLLPKKGINLPGSVYNEKLQFEIYCEFLKKKSSNFLSMALV